MNNRSVFRLSPLGGDGVKKLKAKRNRPVFRLSPLGDGVKKLKNHVVYKSVEVEINSIHQLFLPGIMESIVIEVNINISHFAVVKKKVRIINFYFC